MNPGYQKGSLQQWRNFVKILGGGWGFAKLKPIFLNQVKNTVKTEK